MPFSETVLREALRRTEKSHGPWRIEYVRHSMARARMLEAMQDGHSINLAIVATQPDWESKLLVVRIPVDMGLSGLRIGLIRQQDQPLMARILGLEDLRRLRLGVGMGWSSKLILEANEMRLEMALNQDALARMLHAGRLDYFPRSISEAFTEHARLAAVLPDLAIDRELLLDMPLPTYVFVSPKAPRLAERISAGMETMVRDGSLLRMVIKAHGEQLARAGLCSRRLIRMPNPLLDERHGLTQRALWFDPRDPRTGLCTTASGTPATR
ncbi:amino acid ABC transporter substrate-binding protein [Candidatus Dactylopiibacterium carminicum]|nr:amino acid ABC transporter substrate-binding protein [Candidatus Dactylopiibacterium carminicum]